MSQQLTPLNGGVENVVLTAPTASVNALSTQYIIAKSLESRPTEWVPGGRPIYRRLPAISETYVIDFFNIVSPANTAIAVGLQDIGYVYVPWTENSEGPTSILVSASESEKDLIIRGGKIVWKYGSTQVYPAIINLENLEVGRGRYFLAYELVFDDAPQQKIYSMEDFALTGQPLTITSSTDGLVGWRYPAINAFLNTSQKFWTSKDTYFPSVFQPTTSFLQWTSTLGSAYSKVVLRCPANTAYTAKASFYYVIESGNVIQATVSPSSDSNGQYYEFNFPTPTFNKGWRVEWSDIDVAIESISVSGAITLEKKPAAPTTKAALVLYPGNTEPKEFTYCPLAYVEVSNDFKVTLIEDIRYVIRRDYVPVADWLTKPFDDTLINLFEQVSAYPTYWMAPPSCMKQEYLELTNQDVVIV